MTEYARGDAGTPAEPNEWAIAAKVLQGPRPEVQDIPFQFPLAWQGDRFVHASTLSEPRLGADRARDIMLTGIIDGVGGTYARIAAREFGALAALIDDAGWLTRDYRGEGEFLTGRAAGLFLRASINRRALALRLDAPGGYGLRELLADVNSDLYYFNILLQTVGLASPGPRSALCAAMTIAAIDRRGRVWYANCGDCRAGIARAATGEVEELSRKQTMASMEPGLAARG